ncbi:MAG: methionyl-tRNA formyltransferase [Candidatus Omnitrophica bacterium]|nr:methionyl-tRNA formyltransferase [Candidatus Omnitrophota bacterium]
MRIIFFGTGKFGLPSLKKLFGSGHDIVAVVTQPDRKRGRGWNMLPTSIKAFAEKAAPGVETLQPEEAGGAAFLKTLREKNADVFIVVDYGQYLAKEILDMPAKCCINLHPSLLPKYRGASPVSWAILNGETKTGNTVIKMSKKMDAGDIILQAEMEIGEDENAPELSSRLAQMGAALLLKTLNEIETGNMHPRKQNEARVSYAPKLQKQDGKVNWERPAVDIVRQVRALQPWPGAFTLLNGKTLKIFAVEIAARIKEGPIPGTIVDGDKFIVKTSSGAIRINTLQLEGKKEMNVREFLKGYKLISGNMLGE